MDKIMNESIYRDRYRILRKIGEGGSSLVYMAIDKRSGEPVAIKMIKDMDFGKTGMMMLVHEETKVISYLKHPAIPRVLDKYEDAFVLEYVPGNTLEKVIRNCGKLSEKMSVRIAKELLDIFIYLHGLETPVIYRDLKPANIIIKPDGHVALIDFGAARFYEKGKDSDAANIGTVGFAAPEQFGNLGQTDPRTDIYCFGRTISQIIKGSLSSELEAILEKCTMADREDRFLSCTEIKQALEKYPGQVLIGKVLQNLKIAGLSAAAAVVITLSFYHADAVRSYAAEDAKSRIPAVRERMGNAGIRIKSYMEEQLGSDTSGAVFEVLDELFDEER
ncbi:MAG: serine/threonine protein kinase [Butyrivibrio sp.]|nr:serine/threonine protein kinase [Butyrivibrio sp.]